METLSALDEAQAEAETRAVAIEELEESLEELEETVEELRRLHLDRQPRLPPPDSLDAGDGGR